MTKMNWVSGLAPLTRVGSALVLAAALLHMTAALAASDAPAVDDVVEGTHHVALQIPINTRAPDKIEVTEYFSYGCPHCYQFEPQVNAWKSTLPGDVLFNRTPAVWSRDYQVYAQTYYTADALGVVETVHIPIFRAIHTEQTPLNNPQEMARFFGQFGVDPVDFAKTYASFGVRASLQQAEARGRAYQSRGVPAMIVNGKYRIEGNMAGSNANMLRIVDYLIDKERQARTVAGSQPQAQ